MNILDPRIFTPGWSHSRSSEGSLRAKASLTRGFSLVELLVVIAIVALIAAIAVPNISEVTRSAGEATRLQNAQNVCTVYNAYVSMYQASEPGAPLPYSDRDSAVLAIIGTNELLVTNTRLGTTNSFRLGVPTTNDLAMEKLEMVNGQLLMKGD